MSGHRLANCKKCKLYMQANDDGSGCFSDGSATRLTGETVVTLAHCAHFNRVIQACTSNLQFEFAAAVTNSPQAISSAKPAGREKFKHSCGARGSWQSILYAHVAMAEQGNHHAEL